MTNNISYNHIPVMLNEVIHYLNCRPGKIYVDCTLGGSGHSKAVLEKIVPNGLLIAVDQDKDAIYNAKIKLKNYQDNIRLFHGNFTKLPEFLGELGIKKVDGILADLGISLHQIRASRRGFSFNNDEPLDMRMNVDTKITAEKIINNSSEKELANIFWKYGEERNSRRIAKEIIKARKQEPIYSSARLAAIVCNVSYRSSKQKIHPATRVFMALRIVVNRELDNIKWFMENTPHLLNPKARLCVLSFHSLEDRIVKHGMKELGKDCICPVNFPKCVCNHKKILKILTKKALCPTKEEINSNPMARSTKLRVGERI